MSRPVFFAPRKTLHGAIRATNNRTRADGKPWLDDFLRLALPDNNRHEIAQILRVEVDWLRIRGLSLGVQLFKLPMEEVAPPTELEIAERSAVVRRDWDEMEHRRRAGQTADYEMPEFFVAAQRGRAGRRQPA